MTAFLGHRYKPEQPGVWVSGFFGSGKSHLVKMLQYLWTDFEFADGAKARGLAKLPQNVKDLLTELTQAGKQSGLHAAAGDLRTEAKDSIRLALLGIIFKSVGLPGDYPILPVRCRFWERVLRAVDKAGTGAQLRNPLWVVYEAVKQSAEWPIGNVVIRRQRPSGESRWGSQGRVGFG